MALINKLNDLGDAVRDLTGTADKMTLEQMAQMVREHTCPECPECIDPVLRDLAITQNGNYYPPTGVDGFNVVSVNVPTGGPEVEPIVLTNNQSYGCAGQMASKYIELFGNTVSTKDLVNCSYMFQYYKQATVPFDINCKAGTDTTISNIFNTANITRPPRIVNLKAGTDMNALFYNCENLIEVPDDFCDTWDWSSYNRITYASGGTTFYGCKRLRRITPIFLKNCYNLNTSNYGAPYRGLFQFCYMLDEVRELCITSTSYNSNVFSDTFRECYRLKDMLFETNEDGTFKTANWKSQTIDFSYYIGYGTESTFRYILGFSANDVNRIYDNATYQALKDTEDSWTTDINYSRYNRISAVNTINSLPDCSAYGTNTIKFKGAAGALTDGGAINTMTEEEIAVAAAKGWTVTFV